MSDITGALPAQSPTLPITNDQSGSLDVCPPAAQRGRKDEESSPHTVIRGETPPQIIPFPIAHIDWLAVTLIPHHSIFDNDLSYFSENLKFEICSLNWLRSQLQAIFNFPDYSIITTNRGWNGYKQRCHIGEKGKYGLVALGGEHQSGTIHIELNATACAHVSDWYKVQQWLDRLNAKITRVDLAHDDMTAKAVSIETALAWHASGEFSNYGRPPEAHLIDDLGSGKGKTLYIGSRENGKMLRIYEKGRQLGNPDSPWVRVELELRSKSRIIPWDILTRPSSYLAGAYPCLKYLSAVQDKVKTISKTVEMTVESIQHNLRISAGKSIHVLMHAHGGDAFGVIDAIKRFGVPRRLANHSDFLLQILESSEVPK